MGLATVGRRVGLPALLLAVLAGLLTALPVPSARAMVATSAAVTDPIPVTREPRVTGPQRPGRTLTVTRPRLAVAPATLSYRWLRAGTPIPGATSRRHVVVPADVGSRLRVEVTATAPGWSDTVVLSRRRGEVDHRRDVRRRVTYSIQTRGPVTADVREFARLARQTYADARGWRASGIELRRVRSGGSFTLVLATADELPRFSSGCSAQWSCRVGRYVVINQTRWQQASPAWNAAGAGLRGYRHMVLNHETGHWLGLGHASCPRAGAPAPVMMQQSKALAGCRFNPFPTLAELAQVS